MTKGAHRFRFFRSGGFDQVLFDRAEDLLALDQLDPKLWVALSCPVQGLEFDERTLRLIDADNDGRIRVPEILGAVKWACSMLRDPGGLVQGGDSIALSAIADDHPQARQILASARQIQAELGKADEERISLADVTDTAKIYAQMKFNGDGVVPPGSAGDEATARAIGEIVDCLGGVMDRCGKPGVTRAKVQQSFDDAKALDGWWLQAEEGRSQVLPLGEQTAAAAAIVAEVRAKVDDWFTRSRLAAFDPRAEGPLNRSEAEYAVVAPLILSASGEEVASFPLAKVVPNGALPLEEGLNPAWAGRIARLRADAIEPLIGARQQLTAEDWREVLARLAPFEAWSAARPGSAVQKLGAERVRELLGSDLRERILGLIARDEALEPEANGIALVEKLVRYQRDLYRLLCNFVSFSDFYSKKKAVFQAGTLYLDQRSCDLCIRVGDPQAHAAIATLSRIYLAYCECTRKSDGKKMTIAAAFTGGDSDDLMVGRNGIFYDRQGSDWDATVVKLVEHPISIRQAFWLPYKRIGQLVGGQIERIASAREKDVHAQAATNIEVAGKHADAPPPAAPGVKEQAFDVARFAGVFAAIGLALGALGSALAAITTGFLQLKWWQMPLAMLGVVVLVSGPSMVIAWLKLRNRSLGPILDANGWAVNTRARINIPFGASLTASAALPLNAERYLQDPYAPPRARWATAAALLAVLVALCVFAWWNGDASTWLSAN